MKRSSVGNGSLPFIYQMNLVHDGWNLLPLWNRAQPLGLFEPEGALRRLWEQAQIPSAPSLRSRSLQHCGTQKSHICHSLLFF